MASAPGVTPPLPSLDFASLAAGRRQWSACITPAARAVNLISSGDDHG
jgi:hypothetical protein